jgi:hypothetical protein
MKAGKYTTLLFVETNCKIGSVERLEDEIDHPPWRETIEDCTILKYRHKFTHELPGYSI